MVKQAIYILIVLLISACSAVTEPVYPTPQPTTTATAIATETSAATIAPSPTVAAINAPIATNGPAPTAVIGQLPTRLPFTLTPTTPYVAPGSLQIEYFASNVQTIKPGDNLTLFWSVKGVDKVAIYRLNPDGTRGQTWDRGRTGTMQINVSAVNGSEVDFMLTIDSGGSHMEQKLAVAVTCEGGWFFDPQPAGCPSVTPVYTDAAEQPFQHGRMIWIQAESRVYVFFDDGKQPQWAYYPDDYKDGTPANDPSISPPAGMLQPVRGFGLVWRTKTHVRDRLGWATITELPFAGAIQGDATIDGGTAYIRTRDGNIIYLFNKGESWKLVS